MLQAYLCTDDQVIFYERCGYKKCDPILHSTTATSVFPVPNLKDPQLPDNRSQHRRDNPVQERDNAETLEQPKSPPSPPAPPMPVPPPPPVPVKKTPLAPVSIADHQYMWKKLVE
ncbi:hypothetical protein COOONC_24785 [Cooperia oncophora]